MQSEFHTRTNMKDHVLSKLSRSLELPVFDTCTCQCCVCACACVRVNVCLPAFVCVRCCRLSPSSGLTSCWITHCNGGKQKEREEEEDLTFFSFPFLFIVFDSSLGISATLFLKLHNTLLEVWVEGKGRQRGWRQDTDLNCDDSLGFLPLTSSTLLRGGESVATERNLKDSRGFRHCHEHGLPRGMWVNERALWTVQFIHTYTERITLACLCFLFLYVLPPCSPSLTHTHAGKTRGWRPLTHLFHH